LEISASREVVFPSEPATFSIPASEDGDDDIGWTGGGTPATGSGPRFTTAFSQGGDHVVVARLGGTEARCAIAVCPVDAWLVRAREFFGPSIDFEDVRVTTSWAVRGHAGTAWTCNTVIRFKRPMRAADMPAESTLIHELGHVWEHQSGQAQLLSGLVEQTSRMFGRDPYDYGGPEGLSEAMSLRRFRKEAQAQIVTEHWKVLHGDRTDRKGRALSTPGYAEDLHRLVDGAGIGVSPAARRTVAGSIDTAVAKVVNLVLGRPR
jgi:hypothetical protein